MDTQSEQFYGALEPANQQITAPACAPRNLHPLDEEDRRCDDQSGDIDWDEIIASTQSDWEAGRYREFRAADYPTDEAFIEALMRSMDTLMGRKAA